MKNVANAVIDLDQPLSGQRETETAINPLNMLIQLSGRVTNLRQRLFNLTKRHPTEDIFIAIETLDDELLDSERYLREEAFASISGFGSAYGHQSSPRNLHDGFTYRIDETGLELQAPLWAFGLPSSKRKPASFHHNRSYVREYVFWDAWVQRVVEETGVSACEAGCSTVSVIMRGTPKVGPDGITYNLGTHSFDAALSALMSHQLIQQAENGALALHVIWEPVRSKDEEIGLIIVECNKGDGQIGS